MMMFSYLTQHPAEAELFGEAMIVVHVDKHSAIAATNDCADIQARMDICDTGNLLATILRASERA